MEITEGTDGMEITEGGGLLKEIILKQRLSALTP